MKTYGYVRVSTRDQNLDRQLQAMSDYGIPAKQIYQDKLSGKNFDRPAYQALLKKLKPGDTLVIKSIDRLGSVFEVHSRLHLVCDSLQKRGPKSGFTRSEVNADGTPRKKPGPKPGFTRGEFNADGSRRQKPGPKPGSHRAVK